MAAAAHADEAWQTRCAAWGIAVSDAAAQTLKNDLTLVAGSKIFQ
jgi:hypothetical protein